MPIQDCRLPGGARGYRWGAAGKCYPTRAQAEKQAGAAYANGYGGDHALQAALALDKVSPAGAGGGLGYLRLALDYAAGSVREKDAFGRMHVAVANISKANVCPYYGREIPNGRALGLEPERVYLLLRAPDELEKSVPTWNNLPVLDLHLPTSARDPQKDSIVGTTGDSCAWAPPYLTNSLAIWDGDAIAYVEADEKKELSCGYSYVADMTPGAHEGHPYDGVMRNIVGNHVAIVEEGRAGPDVVIGDEAISTAKTATNRSSTKGTPMIKIAGNTRQALLVSGALAAHITPLLAGDAQIDLGKVVGDVTRANFKRKTPTIIKRLNAMCAGKLVGDADLETVAEVLEGLEDLDCTGEDEFEKKDEGAKDESEEDKDKKAEDEGGEEDDKKGQPGGAKDESEKDDDKDKDKMAGSDKGAKDEDKDDKKEGAMDAAAFRRLAADSRAQGRSEAIAEMQAIDAAKRAVRPYIGEIEGTVEGASQVYRLALDAMIDGGHTELELDGVPASAYPALLRTIPVPGEAPRRQRETPMAGDAAGAKGFEGRFPGAARIRQL